MNRIFHLLAIYAVGLPRPIKSAIVMLGDIFMCLLSIWFSLNLEWHDFFFSSNEFLSSTKKVIWVSFSLSIPIFLMFGFYRAIYRYIGLPAIRSMVTAILIYAFFFASLFAFYGVPGVSRSVGLIQPFLMLVFMGSTRLLARAWLGSSTLSQIEKINAKRVLIYGAGNAGRQLASAISVSKELIAIGFLDDDVLLNGRVLNGLKIYNPDKLSEIISHPPPPEILLAMPSISTLRRKEILEFLSRHKLKVRTLPKLNDIASGKVTLSDIHELDIDDLLGRDLIIPNIFLINQNNSNKRVLVTGAGGSIGSELCYQILKTKPKLLLLVDMSEFALYKVHQKLQAMLNSETINLNLSASSPSTEIYPLLASVCDENRMVAIMNTWKPDTIYHAAAYKHVPLVEHNPIEGIRNNVWGTLVCSQAALKADVKSFVLISTDKAVRPTNIMGASKRLAEMVLQALYELSIFDEARLGLEKKKSTCFSIVRFGNVLGSSGSVVPLFREQIKNGGPITLTHLEIVRYFMSISEAAQLVLQAGALGTGGDVFVLDMGHPVKIYDLAVRMLEISGLAVKNESNPNGDIEIITTGLRPGEKLFEELLIGDNPEPTLHPSIMKAQELFLPWHQLSERLRLLDLAMNFNDIEKVIDELQDLVVGYDPNREIVDWVYRANC